MAAKAATPRLAPRLVAVGEKSVYTVLGSRLRDAKKKKEEAMAKKAKEEEVVDDWEEEMRREEAEERARYETRDERALANGGDGEEKEEGQAVLRDQAIDGAAEAEKVQAMVGEHFGEEVGDGSGDHDNAPKALKQ